MSGRSAKHYVEMDMQPFRDADSVAQQEGHRGHFLYRFGQHRCLNSKHCAVLSFEIRDDGIELGEWLRDMPHLDLQCVVPIAAESTNLVDHFQKTTE